MADVRDRRIARFLSSDYGVLLESNATDLKGASGPGHDVKGSLRSSSTRNSTRSEGSTWSRGCPRLGIVNVPIHQAYKDRVKSFQRANYICYIYHFSPGENMHGRIRFYMGFLLRLTILNWQPELKFSQYYVEDRSFSGA